MFAGQKCRTRESSKKQTEVEIGPDQWHTFASKYDAELVASAGQLFCDPKPTTGTIRATIKAMEDAGLWRHPDVMVVYTNLKMELKEREANDRRGTRFFHGGFPAGKLTKPLPPAHHLRSR
jgi:hypothetical protein